MIIAHRGARNEFPENTLAALQGALALSVDGVEFDVDLAGDGAAYLVHQESMLINSDQGRIERAAADSRRDWLRELTADQIGRLDVGGWFSPKFSGERLPALSDVARLDWGRVTAFVELKNPCSGRQPARERAEQIVRAASAFFDSCRALSIETRVISFCREVLGEMRRIHPPVERVLALDAPKSRLPEASELDHCAGALAVPIEFITGNEYAASSAKGPPLFVYESHEDARGEPPADLIDIWSRCASIGVSGIITDYPRQLLAQYS